MKTTDTILDEEELRNFLVGIWSREMAHNERIECLEMLRKR